MKIADWTIKLNLFLCIRDFESDGIVFLGRNFYSEEEKKFKSCNPFVWTWGHAVHLKKKYNNFFLFRKKIFY